MLKNPYKKGKKKAKNTIFLKNRPLKPKPRKRKGINTLFCDIMTSNALIPSKSNKNDKKRREKD